MDSILDTVKKYIGVDTEYDAFDDQLIMCINTAFGMLREIGVGPVESGYMITGKENVWDEIITDDRLRPVETYICLKTRLLFDPPASSLVSEAVNTMLKEVEWRILLVTDTDT